MAFDHMRITAVMSTLLKVELHALPKLVASKVFESAVFTSNTVSPEGVLPVVGLVPVDFPA
jgi:hypothetical protein